MLCPAAVLEAVRLHPPRVPAVNLEHSRRHLPPRQAVWVVAASSATVLPAVPAVPVVPAQVGQPPEEDQCRCRAATQPRHARVPTLLPAASSATRPRSTTAASCADRRRKRQNPRGVGTRALRLLLLATGFLQAAAAVGSELKAAATVAVAQLQARHLLCGGQSGAA